MKQFYGTKLVFAEPQEKEGKEGYAVKYNDGYTSWSPKDVFDAAYQPLNALSFGHALMVLQDGKKVARSGCNGKGMFLYHVPANTYPAQTEAAKGVFGDMVPFGAYTGKRDY
jgi:hypothetical protein